MEKKRETVEIRKKSVCRAALALCICMLATFFNGGAAVSAADKPVDVTFEELNRDEVFLKQSQPHVCTLTSSAMLVRRAAMLSGNQNWKKITEQSVRKNAWIEGTGLRWSFTSGGISVVHKYFSSKKELISMLQRHPEGVVIYNSKRPHAILVTDYTNGVFYCSDPSNGSPSGRYPIAKASITVESATRCWYVKSPVGLKLAEETAAQLGDMESELADKKEKKAAGAEKKKEAKDVQIPDTSEHILKNSQKAKK